MLQQVGILFHCETFHRGTGGLLSSQPSRRPYRAFPNFLALKIHRSPISMYFRNAHRSQIAIHVWSWETSDLRVAQPRVVEVVADAGGEQDGQVPFLPEDPVEAAPVDHDVHHLRDAEAVTEVVERILAVEGLHLQLEE